MLTAELGCKAGSLPTTYLGPPLGVAHKSVRIWDTIEERFRRRLATWKRQYISKGGRVTLIKSTLSNLPIYFMSLFRIPSLVCKRLEPPYLFHVVVPDPESCVQKARKNPEGLSVGRGEPGKEASFGELGHSVYR